MTNKKRRAAVLLAALILASLMTSVFVITKEADHDCIGSSCPVCVAIEVCRSVLKTRGSAVPAAAALFAVFRFAAAAPPFSGAPAVRKTPISLKVKLLN